MVYEGSVDVMIHYTHKKIEVGMARMLFLETIPLRITYIMSIPI